VTFVYEAFENGGRISGKTSASSVDEALRSLHKMGISPTKIGADGQEMKIVVQVEPIQKLPETPAIPKTVVISSDDDEIISDEEMAEELAAKVNSVSNLPLSQKLNWPPKVPVPEPIKPPGPNEFIEVKRKQSVLFGPYQSIQAEIQRLLSLFGEVKFMQVVQDMRGNVLMSIVIEHDEPLPKGKEQKS